MLYINPHTPTHSNTHTHTDVYKRVLLGRLNTPSLHQGDYTNLKLYAHPSPWSLLPCSSPTHYPYPDSVEKNQWCDNVSPSLPSCFPTFNSGRGTMRAIIALHPCVLDRERGDHLQWFRIDRVKAASTCNERGRELHLSQVTRNLIHNEEDNRIHLRGRISLIS